MGEVPNHDVTLLVQRRIVGHATRAVRVVVVWRQRVYKDNWGGTYYTGLWHPVTMPLSLNLCVTNACGF